MKKDQNTVKLAFGILLMLSFTLNISCREDVKKEESTTQKTSVETNNATTNKTPATHENIAKNPAHGQPGHRCDIPIGAPLNSPPVQKSTGSPVINSGSGSPVQSNSGSTAKINPPHGQPGHRCDVKVGDPL